MDYFPKQHGGQKNQERSRKAFQKRSTRKLMGIDYDELWDLPVPVPKEALRASK